MLPSLIVQYVSSVDVDTHLPGLDLLHHTDTDTDTDTNTDTDIDIDTDTESHPMDGYWDVDVDTRLPGLDLLHHGVGPALDLGHGLHHPTQSLLKLNL